MPRVTLPRCLFSTPFAPAWREAQAAAAARRWEERQTMTTAPVTKQSTARITNEEADDSFALHGGDVTVASPLGSPAQFPGLLN